MYAQPIEIKQDVIMLTGNHSRNVSKAPHIPNIFVVKSGEDLFLIDSGAGKKMKKAIIEAVEGMRVGAKRLILINTHCHVDHICNNDVIDEIEGFEEVLHYVHEKGEAAKDMEEFNHGLFELTDKYFDVLEGPPPPWRFMCRVMGATNRKWGINWLIDLLTFKYRPFNSRLDKAEFLKEDEASSIATGSVDVDCLELSGDAVSINLAPRAVMGWQVGDAIIIKDEAHSPDHVLVFFPSKKLLIAGDLTAEFFPVWPERSSSEKTLEYLKWIIEMACEGGIEIVLDSHHRDPFKGINEIRDFVNRLIKSHLVLKKEILDQFEDGKSITVNDVYRNLRKVRFQNKVIDFYLENQFPKTPMFLKTVIAGILTEEGFKVEGEGKWAKFSRADEE